MTESTPDTEECTATPNDADGSNAADADTDADATPLGLPEVPLSDGDGDDAADAVGEASADDLAGDDLAAALTSHADGVSDTTSTLAAAIEAGEVDAATLAAARVEASELLALLRDVRV